MTKSAVRWAAVVVGITLAVLLAAASAVRSRGQASMAESDRALAAGDMHAAIASARDAAMALCPWSPYPEQGYARLTSIAQHAEERGDFALATDAWRAVGAGLRATRSEADERELFLTTETALVRLASRTCEGDQSRPPAVCAASVKAALAVDLLPAASRLEALSVGAILFLGFGGWATVARERRTRVTALVLAAAGAALATVTLVTR